MAALACFVTLWGAAVLLPGAGGASQARVVEQARSSSAAVSALGRGVAFALAGLTLASAAALFAGIVALAIGSRGRRRKEPDHRYEEPRKLTWAAVVHLVFAIGAPVGLVAVALSLPAETRATAATAALRGAAKAADPRAAARHASAAPDAEVPYLPLPWLVAAAAAILPAAAALLLIGRRRPRLSLPRETLPPAKPFSHDAEAAAPRITDPVLNCYRDMCRLLSPRARLREEMTAREYVDSLRAVGFPVDEVQDLTWLFEEVRYGHRPSGPAERARAEARLRAIRCRSAAGPA